MESKYIDINENNFNSEYIKVVQIEETNKFNVEYNNKYMKIYSYNKLNSFGIKKSYNLYKISCIFNNERYKNIYIGIYEKIKKVFNKNPELNIKNPISKSDTIDFIIEKNTNILLYTYNNVRPILYNELEGFLYNNNIEFLPIVIFQYIEIKNDIIFLNFILKELYIHIKMEYTLSDLNNIFFSKTDTKKDNIEKKKYKLDNN